MTMIMMTKAIFLLRTRTFLTEEFLPRTVCDSRREVIVYRKHSDPNVS